jgi:hypothetical protein
VLRKLLSYEHIVELHVSANDGTKDAHLPVTRGTYGLAWAAERYRDGTPVVFEGYLHRLDPPARQAQHDTLRAALA